MKFENFVLLNEAAESLQALKKIDEISSISDDIEKLKMKDLFIDIAKFLNSNLMKYTPKQMQKMGLNFSNKIMNVTAKLTSFKKQLNTTFFDKIIEISSKLDNNIIEFVKINIIKYDSKFVK